MARLIDADRALEIVRDQGIAHPNAYHLTNYATLILREAPTVDAVELPCKIGDTVYQVDANKIYPITIKNLIYDAGHIAFDENAIGKSVFLTRKEAEAKLGGDGNG